MNIGILTHEPFFPPSGGGSSQAIYLVREMVRRGHAVHVFAPRTAEAAEVAARFGITIHPFTAWPMGRTTPFRSLKYLAYPFFLERLVRQSAPGVKWDLLLAQHSIAAVAAGWLGRSLGCATVLNLLDYLTGYFDSWPRHLAPAALTARLKDFELSLARRYQADGVFTISDELAELVAKTGYPCERILPIYYGYDDALFQPTFQTSLSPLVVMHGSLDHHHLGAFAAQAVVEIHRRCPEARFRFVGPRTQALRDLRRRVQGRIPNGLIEETGFIPYAQVAERIHDATVGIVPYAPSSGAHGTMVAKTVEYAAMGIPMVCTPLRGTMRYWEGNPIIRFSEMNPESFAGEVAGWFGESAERRQAWGRAASAKVRAELAWEPFSVRVVERLEAIQRERSQGGGLRPSEFQA